MVLGAFLIYYPIKDESPRQKLKKLADSVASDKKDIDYLIQRFSYLLDNMAADNGKGSALNCVMRYSNRKLKSNSRKNTSILSRESKKGLR